jgi:hypothetical protein
MAEKQYFTFSSPSTGYFCTDDPAFTGLSPWASNGSWVDIPFKLSEKPLFRPGPRPKVEHAKPPEGMDPGIRFIPYPAPEPRPPEMKPKQE